MPAIGLAALMGLILGLGLGRAHAAPGDDPGELLPPPQTPEQINGVASKYLQIAASSFIPFASSAEFSYPGNGCISKTGGSEARFAHKLLLPAGSTVKFVRLYFYDDSISSVTAFFTTYDAAGNFTELASVGSVDSSGYGSSLSPELDYVINPAVSPVNIVANLGAQDDSTLRFCGVRVAYVPAVTDRIFADGFDPTLL
jgi:hypothetical protein